MLKHIVMWKFAPEAEGKTREENLDYVIGELKKLPAQIPQIRSMQIGKDVLGSEMSYDCGLIVESQYVKKGRTDRATVDFYD